MKDVHEIIDVSQQFRELPVTGRVWPMFLIHVVFALALASADVRQKSQ